MDDPTTLTDEDLTGLYRDVLREQERRRRLVDTPAIAAQLAADYQAAASVGTPPTVTAAETTAQTVIGPGGHYQDADGTEWENTSGAFLAPSVAGPSAYPIGWKRAGASTIDPATVPEWTVGVAYKVGDLVTYSGKTYRVLQAHTSNSTWDPVNAASLWGSV